MEKIPTAEEFLTMIDERDGTMWTEDNADIIKALEEFARMQVIAELKQHIEHPTKPGYKRSDIVARIKELEKQ